MLANELSFHVSLNAMRRSATQWGDMQYAQGLMQALRAQGTHAEMFFRDERPTARGKGDIVLRIVGPHLDEPVIGLPNMVWAISPPNLMTAPVLNRYQKVFVASELLVERLENIGAEAENLAQVTDPRHFHPSKRPADTEELPIVFVGSYAPRAPRRAVIEAIEAGLDVHVWGPGWAKVIPERCWRGKRLDYDGLAEIYARARVVINSHMPQMAFHGMMSNRSFDALASGAIVVSDPVKGFEAPYLPDLIQLPAGPALIDKLRALTAGPEPDMPARLARNHQIAQSHSFDLAAARIIEAAREVIRSKQVAPPIFSPRDSGTAPPITLSPPAASAAIQHDATMAAAREITQIFSTLEYPKRGQITPPAPIAPQDEGVLHALMADLRQAQELLLGAAPDLNEAALEILSRARRVVDSGDAAAPVASSGRDANVVRVMRGVPAWQYAPEDYSRDDLKRHVVLWPRKKQVPLRRPLGVFLHLYYHELAPIFAERIARIDAPHSVYISTDTAAKVEALRDSFPQAEIRVLPNRGRDIYPKYFGFADAYDDHDLVLHLHGKKSAHSGKLEDWLAHNLDCLLPPTDQINRILSLFQTIPELGLAAPVAFQPVISAAHWAANTEIARELAWRMGWQDPLPGNDTLRFPVGSMFWGRVSALRPLIDLRLRPEHFPTEARQIDATTAHAIERLAGVCCQKTGHRMLSIAPHDSALYARFRRRFDTNRALREALARDDNDL